MKVPSLMNLRRGPKLIADFLCAGLTSVAVKGLVFLNKRQTALEDKTFTNFLGIAEDKTRILGKFAKDRMAVIHTIPLTQFYVETSKDSRFGSFCAAACADREFAAIRRGS